MVANEDNTEMQNFIMLAAEYASFITEEVAPQVPETVVMEAIQPQKEHPIFEELRDAAYRLRSTMETADSEDYALGVEMGMQRSADIIERIIRKFSDKGCDLNG